ncbi:MAG: hypothetical protein WDO14_04855 [Bacteroidota bacterium]
MNNNQGLILNEAAVKFMGLKDPIGETITWGKVYTVIGGAILITLLTVSFQTLKTAISNPVKS